MTDLSYINKLYQKLIDEMVWLGFEFHEGDDFDIPSDDYYQWLIETFSLKGSIESYGESK